MPIELIRSFLQQANAQGSRSTALNPLQWALGLVLSALVGAESIHAAPWVVGLLGGTEATIVAAYLVAYFYLMVKDRDALRSERFQLSKMAIERSTTGDSLRGFLEEARETKPPVDITSEAKKDL